MPWRPSGRAHRRATGRGEVEQRAAVRAGALALGATALGSMAVGAAAVGRLAVRSLAVRHGALGTVRIDELDVGRLRVGELVLDAPPRAPHPFDVLRDHQYVNLITLRATGEPVPTPVWFALHEGRLYVGTDPESHKVQRIRADATVFVEPCTVRGRPLGPRIEARARVLGEDEDSGAANRALRDKYAFLLRLGERFGAITDYRPVLEITPAGEPSSTDEHPGGA